MSKKEIHEKELTQGAQAEQPAKLSLEDSLKKEREKLEEEKGKLDETLQEFHNKLTEAVCALQRENKLISSRVNEELDGLPGGISKKAVESVLKMGFPKRGQLEDSVLKLKAGYTHTQSKQVQAVKRIGEVDKELLNITLTVDVEKLCEKFSKFQETWIEMEQTFIRMRDFASALAIADPKFSERVPKDYPSFYLQVFSSLFNAERLSTLSIPYLVENVSNYGQGLLAEGDMSIRRMEERHVFEDNRPQDKTWRGPIPNRENEEAE